MNASVVIRLARPLVEQLLTDLRRPHPFAAERVGFLFTRIGTGPAGTTFLFPVDYLPVPDNQYVHTTRVGAAINGGAIRSAMEHVMVTELGALHVHLHDHCGVPRFSRTDWRDLPDLARSFQHANSHLIHGSLVLSSDAAAGAVWLPDGVSREPLLPKIALVGYPLRSFDNRGRNDDRTLQ